MDEKKIVCRGTRHQIIFHKRTAGGGEGSCDTNNRSTAANEARNVIVLIFERVGEWEQTTGQGESDGEERMQAGGE